MIWQTARPGDVVVFLGAGNITAWAHALPGQIQQIAAEHGGPRAIANDSGIGGMMALANSRAHLIDRLPKPRGRLAADAPLGPQTWFGTGGPAEVLFRPADVEDLASFLKALPSDVPVTVLGVGSNLLVRDGGVKGVVIRLMRGFTAITRRRKRGSGRRGRARSQRGVDGARAGAGRAGVPERHSGHDRRGGGHECRRLWRRARGGPGLGRGG